MAKSICYLRHVCICPSVRPPSLVEQLGSPWTDFHEICYLSIFSEICRENSSPVKIWQELRVHYVKTCVHLWYIAQFFLEWEMVQVQVVEKIKTFCVHKIFFPRKSCRLWDNMEKYWGTRQATDDSVIRRRKDAICMPDGKGKRTDTCTHAHTHSHNIHYFLLFHSNSGYARRPHCYTIRTYPVSCDTLAVLILQSLRARCTAYFKLGQ
jgi:hypothetical protein